MQGKDIAHVEGELVAAARLPRRIPARSLPLKTLAQCRREMAKLYREVRGGVLESSEATRLVYVLAQVGKLIEVAELERRLLALEAKSEAKS
jgi:hypothetical protein